MDVIPLLVYISFVVGLFVLAFSLILKRDTEKVYKQEGKSLKSTIKDYKNKKGQRYVLDSRTSSVAILDTTHPEYVPGVAIPTAPDCVAYYAGERKIVIKDGVKYTSWHLDPDTVKSMEEQCKQLNNIKS